MRNLCLSVSLSFVGVVLLIAGAPRSVGAAIPDAINLLQRTVEAHERLGPATIRGSAMMTLSNGLIAGTHVYKWTCLVRRNDSHHFVIRVVGPQSWDSHVFYVSGRDGIGTDLSGKNALRITDETNTTISGVISQVPFEDLVAGLRHALKTPSGRQALYAAEVTELLADGNPAYRLYWKVSPVPHMSDLDLVIGQREGLIRQMATTTHASEEMKAVYRKFDLAKKEQLRRAGAPSVPPEFSTVWTATFTRQPNRFPASTFTLPKGKRPRKLWM